MILHYSVIHLNHGQHEYILHRKIQFIVIKEWKPRISVILIKIEIHHFDNDIHD